jgi:ankyrin repeat protein
MTSALVDAIRRHDPVSKIRALIQQPGFDPKSKQTMGKEKSPLHVAVITGYTVIVKMLLELGAHVNITDEKGATPLHYSYQDAKFPLNPYPCGIMKLLLKHGANIHARDTQGNTPLLYMTKTPQNAIVYGRGRYIPTWSSPGAETCLKVLLDHGANPGHKDAQGYTALHHAVEKSPCRIVKILVERGAPIDAKTADGRTALDLAFQVKRGNTMAYPVMLNNEEVIQTIKFLMARGAAIHVNTIGLDKFMTFNLNLSDTRVRNTFAKVVLDKIKNAKGSVKTVASLLGKLLNYQDEKHTNAIIHIFRDAGVFALRDNNNHMTIVDALFIDPTLYTQYGSYLCRIFDGSRVRLTDAFYPFHVLVAIAGDCSKVKTSRELKNIVDYLISKGYDINASFQGETAIHLLEKYINSLNGKTKIERDLHSIMVSRGAITRSGRKYQRNIQHYTASTGIPTKRMTMRNHIKQWTNATYQPLQNARRGGLFHENVLNERVYNTNRYLSQAFRNGATRVPVIPREFTVQYNKSAVRKNARPQYLYRGVHGQQANMYLTHGKMKDSGYIAFSRNDSIAHNFATKGERPNSNSNTNTNTNTNRKSGLVLRLKINSIPKGTPWLWFHGNDTKKASSHYRYRDVVGNKTLRKRNLHASNIDEEEVLLPPGTIRLKHHVPDYYGTITPLVYDAEYIPNTSSTSLPMGTKQRRKKLYRKKDTSSENGLVTWFSTLFNSNATSTKKRPRPNTVVQTKKKRV